jgi:hypothetical protein
VGVEENSAPLAPALRTIQDYAAIGGAKKGRVALKFIGRGNHSRTADLQIQRLKIAAQIAAYADCQCVFREECQSASGIDIQFVRNQFREIHGVEWLRLHVLREQGRWHRCQIDQKAKEEKGLHFRSHRFE